MRILWSTAKGLWVAERAPAGSPAAAYGIDDQVDVAIQFLAEVTGPCIVIGTPAGAGTAFGALA